MKVEKTSFGYLVILMVEEQNDRAVMEEIKKLKENGKVAVLISGNENALVGISKVIKNTIQRE